MYKTIIYNNMSFIVKKYEVFFLKDRGERVARHCIKEVPHWNPSGLATNLCCQPLHPRELG
jgi:hypothetical protein